MSAPAPHFLLFSESRRRSAKAPPCDWRFVLQSLDGSSRLEAEDAEPAVGGERLELLAVVRGLEALEQPSRVTLVTPSKYVSRGLSYGLQDWRDNDWNWEHHGQMVPIKNRDLWQRLDRALGFHRVQCRTAVAGEGVRGQGSGVRDEECLSPVGGEVCKSENSANAAPKNAGTRLADIHAVQPHAPWRETAMRIWSRFFGFCRRLKSHLEELESPLNRWRVS